MTDDRWTDKLSDYLDGELDAAERDALEAHLATCADCRAALDDLHEVVRSAASLEDRPPTRDLWPAIRDRLEPPSEIAAGERGRRDPSVAEIGPRRRGAGRPPRPERRRFSFTLPQLAAAAALVALVPAGAVWLASGGAADPSSVGSGPAAAAAADSSPLDGAADVRLATSSPAAYPAGEEYDAAVADLESVLEGEADQLDPATVAAIRQSLATIDRAIREAYRALADDPADPYLNHHLADVRQRKLQLLRRAVDLARTET